MNFDHLIAEIVFLGALAVAIAGTALVFAVYFQ